MKSGTCSSGISIEGSITEIYELIKKKKVSRIITLVGPDISPSGALSDIINPSEEILNTINTLGYTQSSIFEISNFKKCPRHFYSLLQEHYPYKYMPTPCHYFIRMLHELGLLLRHYTMNIDCLEYIAGVSPKKIVPVHGSFWMSHCLTCNKPFKLDQIKDAIFNASIPKCDNCNGLIKPSSLFYGEDISMTVCNMIVKDFLDCDLLIVMGTSLDVLPFGFLTDEVGKKVRRVFIGLDKMSGRSAELKLRQILTGKKQSSSHDIFVRRKCDDACFAFIKGIGHEKKFAELIENDIRHLHKKVRKELYNEDVSDTVHERYVIIKSDEPIDFTSYTEPDKSNNTFNVDESNAVDKTGKDIESFLRSPMQKEDTEADEFKQISKTDEENESFIISPKLKQATQDVKLQHSSKLDKSDGADQSNKENESSRKSPKQNEDTEADELQHSSKLDKSDGVDKKEKKSNSSSGSLKLNKEEKSDNSKQGSNLDKSNASDEIEKENESQHSSIIEKSIAASDKIEIENESLLGSQKSKKAAKADESQHSSLVDKSIAASDKIEKENESLLGSPKLKEATEADELQRSSIVDKFNIANEIEKENESLLMSSKLKETKEADEIQQNSIVDKSNAVNEFEKDNESLLGSHKLNEATEAAEIQ